MGKITSITLQESRSDKVSSYLGARIDDEGDLVLEGQDIGEFVEEWWGDSDYEYWVCVKKECKDKVLWELLKERCTHASDLSDWLKEKDIPLTPCHRSCVHERAEFLGQFPEDYQDTVLLWLLKERFTTSSEFQAWLRAKDIPYQFWSWA